MDDLQKSQIVRDCGIWSENVTVADVPDDIETVEIRGPGRQGTLRAARRD